MRDASLDEFLTDTDERNEGSGDEVESGSETEPDAEDGSPSGTDEGAETEREAETAREADTDPGPEGPPTVEDVEPARSTFAWSPDGVACAECGQQVAERWESDAGLVCTECKSW